MNYYQVLVLLLIAAANKTLAKTGFGPGDQDWGYADVREGAHMFYWLYKTTADVENIAQRPLVIWLQGGPGFSSTGIGNFGELGPLDLNGNYRESNWIKDMNVLFIDSPVGTGFSYVDDYIYLTTNNSDIALDLVECMKVFFSRHKEFEDVPLHIFTEGYGGKMAPEFALELYYANQRKEIKCNLLSIAMGNPSTSMTDTLLSWAPYLYYTGIVDMDGYKVITASVNKTLDLAENNYWSEAYMQSVRTQFKIDDLTNNVNFYNILKPVEVEDEELWQRSTNIQDFILPRSYFADQQEDPLESLMSGPVSKALDIPPHVNFGSQAMNVKKSLADDLLKPAVHIVSEILNKTNLKVGVYSGQLDLICPTAGAISWIDKLQWHNRSDYINAPRQPINVNGYVEGYEKSGGKFNMFWVNRAGHSIPTKNPDTMSYILKKFTNFG